MTREEFCNILMNLKGDESLNQLSYKCQMNTEMLRRLLNGSANYFVESAARLAKALGALIVVTNDNEQIELNNQTTLTWWAQRAQQASGLSINKFKDEIGLTRVALTANLKGESKMRIDTLLKWAEVTGYRVEVWKK